MSDDLLYPPPRLTPAVALHLSQEAPRILKKSTDPFLPYPLSLLSVAESPELWVAHENLFLSCLRTGDDKAALTCLDRLSQRFGDSNEKILAMKGMYEEAVAKDARALEAVLKGYDKTLKEDPQNTPIRKRRIALLRSLERLTEATNALVELLEVSPTDIEAWAEIADVYYDQGMYPQAMYALEEVLLIAPNAWNIHARLGEISYIASMSNSDGEGKLSLKGLAESTRRFCRSIELCDDYLRGYYGLKLTSKRLGELLASGSKPASSPADSLFPDSDVPSLQKAQKLNELATKKLGELVRRGAAQSPGADGFQEPELIAARELLDRDLSDVPR